MGLRFFKIIDRLLISSFIPPFIVTFMIAIFVLLMQMLWLYIDDIAGKGVGLFVLIELLSYKCVSLIPMALPLAMLISSVMVLGNLAERYELSSLKSAGVPLLRVMRPLMFFGLGVALFSFICSDYLIPIANLNFGSRMYDIQKQKPALRLDQGVFNDDFQGYSIHIGKKMPDGRNIEDVLIYDHSSANQGNLSTIIAESGEMYNTKDGRYFIMVLKNGHQYMETKPSAAASGKSFPFIRTDFNRWTKIFDLGEFDLNTTNQELFKSNRHMMTSAQLKVAADSIQTKIDDRETNLSNHVSQYFYFMEQDSTEQMKKAAEKKRLEEAKFEIRKQNEPQKRLAKNELSDSLKRVLKTQPNPPKSQLKNTQSASKNKRRSSSAKPAMAQIVNPDSTEVARFDEVFASSQSPRLISKAKTFARSILGQADTSERSLSRMKESKVKHIYERHTKFSMAVICFIFLFVGAPMGAIVRKGGFGYPILISIIFFMLFIVLTIFCRKVAESFVVPAEVAAWIPCAILFPIGILLTSKAMNDSKLINLDAITSRVSRLFKNLKKEQLKADSNPA